jgi:hypothetical protein
MRAAGRCNAQQLRTCASAHLDTSAAPEPCLALTDDWRRPLLRADQLRGRRGVAVAIGKFDAMHTGHRALAEATAALDCFPCLLSFRGMAQVLNLPPRQPLVADAQRRIGVRQHAAASRQHSAALCLLTLGRLRLKRWQSCCPHNPDVHYKMNWHMTTRFMSNDQPLILDRSAVKMSCLIPSNNEQFEMHTADTA